MSDANSVVPTLESPADSTRIALLPLRDVVVFPNMVLPLFVGRARSVKALEISMETNKEIMLVAQKIADKNEPAVEDIYRIGCVARILQLLKLPDGTVKVLVEGTQRAEIVEIIDSETHYACRFNVLNEEASKEAPRETAKAKGGKSSKNPSQDGSEMEALRRAVLQTFEQYVKMNRKIPAEIVPSLAGLDDDGRLADTITAHLPLKIESKQQVLETLDKAKRLEVLLGYLEGEMDIMQVDKRIRGRVKKQMEKSQREYYLNEQVKAIQKELGEGEDGLDLEEMKKRIKKSGLSKEAIKKAEGEWKKLKLMSPMSAEASVIRNYIDTLCNLPWRKKTKLNSELLDAEKILDGDHYGLEKVKERIVEYLAVQ